MCNFSKCVIPGKSHFIYPASIAYKSNQCEKIKTLTTLMTIRLVWVPYCQCSIPFVEATWRKFSYLFITAVIHCGQNIQITLDYQIVMHANSFLHSPWCVCWEYEKCLISNITCIWAAKRSDFSFQSRAALNVSFVWCCYQLLNAFLILFNL